MLPFLVILSEGFLEIPTTSAYNEVSIFICNAGIPHSGFFYLFKSID